MEEFIASMFFYTTPGKLNKEQRDQLDTLMTDIEQRLNHKFL